MNISPQPINRTVTVSVFVIALLLNTAAWGLLFWKLPPTDNQVFLHYNTYFGVDKAGPWRQLLLIPISGTVIVALNAFHAFFFPRQQFADTLLLIVTPLLQFGLLGVLFLLVLLNV